MSWLNSVANPLESDLAERMGGTFDEAVFLNWVEDASDVQENLWRVVEGGDGASVRTKAVALYTQFIDGPPPDGIYAGNLAQDLSLKKDS